MKRNPVVALAASVFLGGCVNTHNVSRDEARMWVVQAQENLHGEEVTLTATSRAQYRGTVETVDEDSILLRQEGAPRPTSFSLDTVVSVTSPTNVAPALGGLLLGGLLGGLIGGAAAAEEPEAEALGVNTFATAAEGATVGVLVGGAVGVVAVALLTATDSYIIVHPPAVKQKPAQTDSTATYR